MKRALVAAVLSALFTGCATAPAGPSSVTEALQRPAERALLAGLRAYEDAQYAEAERELNRALTAGLASATDRANAHKHLAFLHCASQRLPQCEAAFRSALAADREFALTKAEAGHPLWGPVYRRVTGVR